MTGPNKITLMLITLGLIIAARTYALVKLMWNGPLRNGRGYFLGVEVAEGFYDGPGARWLKSYHTVVAAEFAIEICALGILLALAQWMAIPIWAGGCALLCVATMLTFVGWTRHALGANPPVRPMALALESRRLGDYISWPLEALAGAAVAFSWWLLLRHGGSHVDWRNPLLFTWIALGLAPGKIVLVRSSFPLPADRTEEHYRYQDAARRLTIRQFDAVGWFMVMCLLGAALRPVWFVHKTFPGLQWLFEAAALAIWGYLMMVVFRGSRRLAAMGRDLRPSGSWATPFRGASMTTRPYLVWCTLWFGGVLGLILYSFL